MKFVIISLLIGTLLVMPSFSAPSGDDEDLVQLPKVKIDQRIAAYAENTPFFLTCYDMNKPDRPVRWIRENNLPLPSSAMADGGFLHIRNLQPNDVGIYICETPDFPPSTPGQRASVMVLMLKPDPNPELPELTD